MTAHIHNLASGAHGVLRDAFWYGTLIGMDAVKWMPIECAPGYDVSEDGRIRCWRPRNRMASAPESPRDVRTWKNHRGYEMVTLHRGSRRDTVHRCVHQLVLEAFVGLREDGQEVRHLNGNRSDNRLENLAWGTKKENAADRVRHGTNGIGERNPFARLTEADVREIRRRALAGEVSHLIAKDFPCNARNVRSIKSGRAWAHLWKETETEHG